jgi:uncharacterized protein YndB with AHSA1/START domain
MKTEANVSLDSVMLGRHFDTTRDALWKRISTEHIRTLWWPDSTLNLVAGGTVATQLLCSDGSTCELTGMNDVFIEGHALGFSWHRPNERHETSVLLTLTSLMGSTQLSVLEIGFRTAPNSAERLIDASNHWTRCLTALGDAITHEAHENPAHTLDAARS